ncbi:hypothetical protein NG794_23030 [Laspinema sp. D6]|nr:hypothetical protein [Laspinema sp. D3a]
MGQLRRQEQTVNISGPRVAESIAHIKIANLSKPQGLQDKHRGGSQPWTN